MRQNDLAVNVVCSGNAVYVVPWYTGPGGIIDTIAVRFSSLASVAAHMGIYAANHVRMPTPGGLLVQTSVTLTGATAIATASVGFIAAANAMMYVGFQLPESRTFDGPTAAEAFNTMGFDTASFTQGTYGMVCSYAYASGLPPSLAIGGVNRIGNATVPFIGVHYA